jgi:hypothetical protein
MRRLAVLLVLMCLPAFAQLLPSLPGGPLGGAPQQSPQSGPGNYDRKARPLKAWISDDQLDKRKRDWKRTQTDAALPWIKPDQRVEAWRHVDHYDEYGDRKEVRWHIGDRLAYPPYAIDYPISDFVLKDPVSKDWVHSGESMQRPDEWGSRDLLISPYRLQLIAVEPLVVALVPYQNPDQPQHRWNGPRKELSAEDDAIDHEDIRYETDFPARDGTLWCSPTEKIAVQPLVFDAAGVAKIDAGLAHLRCERKDKAVRCTRTAE